MLKNVVEQNGFKHTLTLWDDWMYKSGMRACVVWQRVRPLLHPLYIGKEIHGTPKHLHTNGVIRAKSFNRKQLFDSDVCLNIGMFVISFIGWRLGCGMIRGGRKGFGGRGILLSLLWFYCTVSLFVKPSVAENKSRHLVPYLPKSRQTLPGI